MGFETIDMEKWPRKETFEHFSTVAKSTYSLTVMVDVTRLVELCKKTDSSFYPVFTWIVSSALNQLKQFRMGYNDKAELGYFDKINPMYPVMDSEENVVSLCTEYVDDVKEFCLNMVSDMERYKSDGVETSLRRDFFIVSTLPWIQYESFTVLNESNQHFLFPMVTWGEYSCENGKYKMPLSFQISHAVADGYHCAQFYKKVESLINDIEF